MKSHDIPFQFRCLTCFGAWFAATMLVAVEIHFAPPASAAAFSVSAFATVSSMTPQDTGILIGQTATTAEVSFSGGGRVGEAEVRAAMGDLGVRVFAASEALTQGQVAAGIATFSDELTITSATLPLGTPVSLQFTMQLDGTTQFDPPTTLANYLDSNIYLTGQAAGFGHNYIEHHRSGRPVAITGDNQFTLNSTVGSTFGFVGRLHIDVRSDFLSVPSSALSDYLASAKFFAMPSSSDVSIVSASGHDYAIIPEPQHYAFAMSGGLACLSLLRRCRKQR
ncbi:MAG: hypothetical protein KIT22_14250 [Verrucomicrobiae bacterium]|nr:hypothetical protein [Verrucomicrobiae bacterium]